MSESDPTPTRCDDMIAAFLAALAAVVAGSVLFNDPAATVMLSILWGLLGAIYCGEDVHRVRNQPEVADAD